MLGAILGGAVVSGLMADRSARRAADASNAATAATIGEQQRQYDLNRQDTAPYREAGANALNYLTQNYNNLPQYTPFQYSPTDYANSPAYQFQLEQGMNAINRGAAKSGNLRSGNRLLELQKFGQGLASQGYAEDYARQMQNHLTNYGMDYQRANDVYGRNYNLAGMGMGAVNQNANIGQNMANNVGNALMSNASNQSNAAAMRYGGLNNAVQGGISNYLLYNSLNPSPAAQPPINYNTISYNDINRIWG